jgi:hypothetical protein
MEPNLILTSMFPSVSLQEKETLNQLLNVFELDKNFIPTKWGNNELIRLDYNQTEIMEKVLSKEKKFDEIYLYRTKNIKYNGSFDTYLSSRSFLNFSFDKSMPQKYWDIFFYLTDQIAEIVKPRYGVTHIVWPSPTPWTNERERQHKFMNFCSGPIPVGFGPNGPSGVGMRTYFSGDVLKLFGREFLKNTPAVVTELEWGGIRIDLLEKPWEADIDMLLDSWIKVMNYLEPAKVLAVPCFNEDKRGVSFSANSAWKNR